MTDTATAPPVTIVAANEASWDDLQAVLGTRGYPASSPARASGAAASAVRSRA